MMYKISIIGQFHLNHNEDSSVILEIGEDILLCAVMDGCSMGQESHFASTLLKKLLRKIGKEINYKEFIAKNKKTTKGYLKDIIQQLFAELRQIKNLLHLERDEILSTIILAVLDKTKKEIELIAVGDGLICCNLTFTEFEQNNKPDYLGYHLNEAFDNWFESHPQRLSLKDVRNFSMTTDGIFTFRGFDDKKYDKITEKGILEYLLIDEEWANQENMLNKKLIEIEKKYGLKPSDDLTIIRLMID
ncbi:MAG: protein phosphatase 2C domain-containing protein [Saprospiraceae bacterium]|nr:protein phosphatase 2C domain-containing protein [Saprospiraceae bacterium]